MHPGRGFPGVAGHHAARPPRSRRAHRARTGGSCWQLPGGSLEPPQDGAVLDESALAGQAVRELAEELGIGAAVEELKL
ncbi:NUDIX hydrolase [Streptomyces antibioticus]|uniref:NUDIX hydrolase n=1 Tax=Streptomyces antibioticus TaxID=1890 RepID=UPI0036DA28AD